MKFLKRNNFVMNNKRSIIAITLMIFSYFGFYSISLAKNIVSNGLIISNFWIKEPIRNQSITSGYLTIENTNEFDEYLINITSKISQKIEIHKMTIKNDIMRMKPLDGGLKIKAGSIINLRPGSYHIMFMKLIKNIKAKNNHIISLNFKKSGVVSINIPVYKRFLKKISNKHNQ